MLKYSEVKARFDEVYGIYMTPEDIAYTLGIDIGTANLALKNKIIKSMIIGNLIRTKGDYIDSLLKSEETYYKLMDSVLTINKPVILDSNTDEDSSEAIDNSTEYNDSTIFNAKYLRNNIDRLLWKSKKANRNNFVYFITDGTFVKIGITNRITYRLNQLQTGNPRPLRLMFAFMTKDRSTSKTLEEYFHTLYNEYRSIGEWFKIYKH